ncbi:deoxynucleoside kinase [Brevibacillus fulvus]|uniref:Deoxyguanosine kinase n=1 Tax=Brevibacillus fulvus TaxID=1125967 RepID=A0A938XVG4_9BACL|nr:deoxynucleoside kinase [Brevibacillus fulvus]MBM7588448.1 deoxyguanosine kinase [Brevibacillus fulvus]
MKPIFVTVEGPIGVGKTSLSQAISQELQLELLLEIVDENPFLSQFYQNISEWSFQLEMFFLCNRYKQLQDIENNYLHKGISVVADYNIFKNTIFARRTLNSRNLPKYLKIYDILTSDLPQANLIVYLTASIDTLMQRIAKRGREMEKNMDVTYMENLIADYERFMQEFQLRHPETTVLKFQCDDLDFVHKPEDRRFILDQVRNAVQTQVEKNEYS